MRVSTGKSSTELLVYSSQLRKGEYAKGWGGTPEFEAAVQEAAKDRLALAEAFCASAERLTRMKSPDEIDSRNAISRAYYSCHHAIRTCALAHQSGDEPDHRAAILAFVGIIKNQASLRAKVGSAADIKRQLEDLIHCRHIADYYPYGASYPLETPLDFAQAARDGASLARKIVDGVRSFLAVKGGKK